MKRVFQRMSERLPYREFLKYCLVGGSGMLVDMTVLHFLADPKTLGWNVSLSKVCSAECAMLNNFLWNEIWTFRNRDRVLEQGNTGWTRRLLKFNAICGIGIGLAVFFLHIFHSDFRMNLYLANFFAIVLATLWNFWMNAVYNWKINDKHQPKSDRALS